MAVTVKTQPIHPGEVLLEDFLRPMHITQRGLANAVGVPPRRINEIVLAKRGITADTALRLARYFGTSERFWLNLQARYEIETERDQLADTLALIRPRQQDDAPSRDPDHESASIRDWALANGYSVSTRGRIPEPIRNAYRRAVG